VPAVRKLMHRGIEIHDTTCGRLTPDAVLFQAFISNYEVRAISQRTTMGLLHRAREGRKLGTPLLGYRRTLTPGVYEPDPDVAPVIEELFRRYAAGEGLRVLTCWLNGRLGLPKPPPPGRTRGQAARTPASVGKLLSNPSYKGINVSGAVRNSKLEGRYARPHADWHLVRSLSPALISPALWDACQARRAQNRNVGQERPRVRYAFSGLVWCKRCTRRMAGHRGRGGYDEYVCTAGCTMSRSARRVQARVRQALGRVTIGPQMIDAALAREGTGEHAALRADLEAVEDALARQLRGKVVLTQLYRDGHIDTEAFRATVADDEARTKELRAQRSMLEQRLAQSTAVQATLQETAAWLRAQSSWTALLDHASAAEVRRIYRECVARLTFDPSAGTLTVTWTPQVARLCGREAEVLPLPAQRGGPAVPKTPPQTVALIQELAAVTPRPTARQVQQQLRERGLRTSQRTIKRYTETAPAKRGRPAQAG
jgi:Recombinase/Recombinase zinc beta ribbon domain